MIGLRKMTNIPSGSGQWMAMGPYRLQKKAMSDPTEQPATIQLQKILVNGGARHFQQLLVYWKHIAEVPGTWRLKSTFI